MKFLAKSKWIITCLILVVVMMIPMVLTSCDKDNEGVDWNTTNANAVSLELAIKDGETNRTLVLSYKDDIFAEDVKDSQLKVLGYDLTEGETANQKSDKDSAVLTGWSVKRDSAKQLTITLPAGEASKHWGYAVNVHPSATINNSYGEGWILQTISEELDDID